MRNIFLLILFSLFSIFSSVSIAQAGQLEDVIEAAMDNREPAYIKELMDLLSENLQVIVRERNIRTPKQMLALMLTMRAMVTTAYVAAREAAYEVGGMAADNAAQGAAGTLAGNVVSAALSENWNDAGDASNEAHDFAYKAALTASRGAALDVALTAGPYIDPAVRGRIIFRVAEWTALNYFFNHIMSNAFASIFDVSYNAGYFNVRVEAEDNPFSNFAAWNDFRTAHFAHLSVESLILLAPWLSVLDSLVFAEHQAPNALSSVSAYVQQEFVNFPREIVVMLLLLASHAHVHHSI